MFYLVEMDGAFPRKSQDWINNFVKARILDHLFWSQILKQTFLENFCHTTKFSEVFCHTTNCQESKGRVAGSPVSGAVISTFSLGLDVNASKLKDD